MTPFHVEPHARAVHVTSETSREEFTRHTRSDWSTFDRNHKILLRSHEPHGSSSKTNTAPPTSSQRVKKRGPVKFDPTVGFFRNPIFPNGGRRWLRISFGFGDAPRRTKQKPTYDFLKDKKIPGVRGTPALVATRLDNFVVVVVVLGASIGSSTIDSMNCRKHMAEQQDNQPYITRNNNNGQ